MKLEKEVKYLHYANADIIVTVLLDVEDDDKPINVCIHGDDKCKWMSIEDARGLVKAVNAALKELK